MCHADPATDQGLMEQWYSLTFSGRQTISACCPEQKPSPTNYRDRGGLRWGLCSTQDLDTDGGLCRNVYHRVSSPESRFRDSNQHTGGIFGNAFGINIGGRMRWKSELNTEKG